MNLCLPYTYLVNDLFRCLCGDLQIAFTEAPVPGKYTAEIGESLGEGNLCRGLETVLGSLVECSFLGADTAVLFAPCASCSAERIRMKVQNALTTGHKSLNLIVLEADKASQSRFWSMLKVVSPVSVFYFWEARSRFYECARLLQTFVKKRNGLRQTPTNEFFVQKVLREIFAAQSLLQLKIVLAAFTKKMETLETKVPALPFGIEKPPYNSGDYFDLKGENDSVQLGSFFCKKHTKAISYESIAGTFECSKNPETTAFLRAEKPRFGRV